MGTPGFTADCDDARDYFDSYDDLDVHQLMLKDTVRIKAYKNAIFSCVEYFKDKVVMDVGAGTGILSLFCAQAGARMVYAVEASALANIIPKVAKENNFSEVIKQKQDFSLHHQIHTASYPVGTRDKKAGA